MGKSFFNPMSGEKNNRTRLLRLFLSDSKESPFIKRKKEKAPREFLARKELQLSVPNIRCNSCRSRAPIQADSRIYDFIARFFFQKKELETRSNYENDSRATGNVLLNLSKIANIMLKFNKIHAAALEQEL
jgi:hypothetical protein